MKTLKLSIKEKISYGLGDAGCNIVWQTAMLFLAYFYTDVYGLSPVHMGTMFLVVRLIDAISDPVIGTYIDKKPEHKDGRYRPFLKWFAIPFGIACTLVFYTPALGETGKLFYAYGSYIVLNIIYSILNVPYCALGNTLTKDSNERTSLQSYRFALNTISGLLVVLLALPLVDIIGAGNKKIGYFGAIAIMSVIAAIMFLCCFYYTKERYKEQQLTGKNTVLIDFKNLLKSGQWFILFSANIILLAAILIKNSTTLYYVNNVLKRPELATDLMVTTLAFAIGGAVICAPLFNRFEKSKAYSFLVVVTGLLSISLYFVDSKNITAIFILTAAYGFVQMATSPLIWSMLADLADYESVRAGRTLNGVVFSTILFAIKAGIAIGGAAVGWVLAFVGYKPGIGLQTLLVNNTINLMYTVVPGIILIMVSLILIPYKLDKKKIAGQLANKKSLLLNK